MHTQHPETNQQNSVLLQTHHRQNTHCKGRRVRSPAHVAKYILARMSISFPLDKPDTPNSKGRIQWSQNTLQRRGTASTLKQPRSQLISRGQFEHIITLVLVVNNPTSYLGSHGFI